MIFLTRIGSSLWQKVLYFSALFDIGEICGLDFTVKFAVVFNDSAIYYIVRRTAFLGIDEAWRERGTRIDLWSL